MEHKVKLAGGEAYNRTRDYLSRTKHNFKTGSGNPEVSKFNTTMDLVKSRFEEALDGASNAVDAAEELSKYIEIGADIGDAVAGVQSLEDRLKNWDDLNSLDDLREALDEAMSVSLAVEAEFDINPHTRVKYSFGSGAVRLSTVEDLRASAVLTIVNSGTDGPGFNVGGSLKSTYLYKFDGEDEYLFFVDVIFLY